MTDVWQLPGYDVQSLVGFGATGEVWTARELATGDTVALKRLRPDADPAAVEALRREASLLRSLDTPYVVRLRAVVGEGAGAVLVLDHAPGGSLAGLLARRGSLEPGEVVTIAAPLAAALATAHARGLVHGDVSPANVLFSADGMPLLADLGVARMAGERLAGVDGTAEYVDPAVAAGGNPDPASDVWALAAVCHHLLAGSPPHDGASVDDVLTAATSGERAPLGLLAPTAPRALVTAVEAALVADPRQRPDAAAFSAALRRAHAAAPVRLTGGPAAAGPVPAVRATHAVRPATTEAEARRRGWRPPRGLLVGAVAALLLVAAATVGWLSGRGADPDPPGMLVPAATAAPSPEPAAAAPADWAPVLDDLDAARARAFEAADAGLLDAVYAPGSPGLASDAALIGQLAAAGQTAHGLRHEVRAVTELDVGTDTARLRVVDVLAAYEVRSGDAVLRRAQARGETPFLVELVRTGEGWRLVEVVPED